MFKSLLVVTALLVSSNALASGLTCNSVELSSINYNASYSVVNRAEVAKAVNSQDLGAVKVFNYVVESTNYPLQVIEHNKGVTVIYGGVKLECK